MSTPKGPDDFDDVDVREDQTPDKPGYGDDERGTVNQTPACGTVLTPPTQTPACEPPKPPHKH